MGKFKIGDRVRALVSWGSVNAGEVRTVEFLDDGGEVWLTRNVDGTYNDYFTDGELELIPALTIEPGRHYRTRSGKPTGRASKGDTGFEAVVDGKVRIFDAAGGAVHGGDDIVEEWVPRVGERVIVVKTDNFHPAVSSETECVVDSVTGDEIWLNASTESAGVLSQLAYLSDLEPLPVAVPQPAALKLEAGKFYRTRDGRKVGPMEIDDWGDGQPWTDGFQWFCNDGNWSNSEAESSNDIIAEWQDTPSAPVAAQVDAIAEEYGPTPQREPDTTLNIKFTSDFSELDAAILVRKKKLKKLIKLARKAGIELREAA